MRPWTGIHEKFRSVPAAVRRHADIDPGDRLRGAVDEEGTLPVELVEQCVGGFEDLEYVYSFDDEFDTERRI